MVGFDQHFRGANDYALRVGASTGFPTFRASTDPDGAVLETILLPKTSASLQDVPRHDYYVYDIEKIGAMFRAASAWAEFNGLPTAWPNFHQSATGTGVVYGTVVPQPGIVERRDVLRSELKVFNIDDAPAMMHAAQVWAVTHGYAAGLPTFHQSGQGAGVVCGLNLFLPDTVKSQNVSADLLAAFSAPPTTWGLLLCHASDRAPGDRNRWVNFFAEGGSDPGGVWRYWEDVSFGLARFQTSVRGWFDLGHTMVEINSFTGRAQRARIGAWGLEAARRAGVNPDSFSHVIIGLNSDSDHGASAAGVVLAYREDRAFEPTFIAHEMGHGLGLAHSFSQATTPCAGGDARPGAYCDRSDLMSAMNVSAFFDEADRRAGPGLSAPNLVHLGWLHRSRIWRGSASMQPTDISLGPLNDFARPHFLAARIDGSMPAGTLAPVFAELRQRSGWDRGIPNHAIVLHTVGPDGLCRLLSNFGTGGRLLAGQEVVLPGIFPVVIRVVSLDVAAGGAVIRVWSLPIDGLRIVRIAGIVYDPQGDEPQGENVTVRNDSLADVDLVGWTLADKAGHTFIFPSVQLAPGSEVRVTTGVGDDTTSTLYWDRAQAVWNNSGDTATLRRPDGTISNVFAYGDGG